MKKNKARLLCINKKDTFVCERIVAFGDSMIEGAELLDHNLPVIGKLKSKMNAYDWSNLIFKHDLIEQHLKNKEQTKKLSYPAQLSQMLQREFINHGIGGNSLESVCWQLLNHHELRPTDLILIGLPPVERLWKMYTPMSTDCNILFGWEESYKEFGNNLVDWYSEPRLVWEYIKCLSVIEHYKRTVHPHVYVMPQWQSINHLADNLESAWKEALKPQIEKIYKSDLFLFFNPLYYLRFMNKLEHGHPTLRSHIKMAEHIIKYYIKPL